MSESGYLNLDSVYFCSSCGSRLTNYPYHDCEDEDDEYWSYFNYGFSD